MKAIAFVAVILVASTALAAGAPDGWKVLTDRSKTCQISVPSDWVVDAFSPSSASSPDKKASEIMHATRNQTLSEVKSSIEMVFPPTKVIEDSPSRLWYAYKAAGAAVDSPAVSWYVGIPAKGNVCGVQIDFKDPAMEPAMKQIATSMAAAK